jgi:hypothetical protein
MLYLFLLAQTYLTNPVFAQAANGAACAKGSFFSFPRWYKYLQVDINNGVCSPRLDSLNDIWLILLAIIEMLLRIATIAAIIFLFIAGQKFITARGNPEKIDNARNAAQDAIIGLVIAIAATAVVAFIGGRFNAQ